MYSGGADGEIRIGAAGSLRGSYKAQYAGTRSAHDFHIGTNSTNMLSFDGGGSVVVVNEAGADRDFRVEGDSNANMFVVDASNDTIGIGTQPNNNNLSPAMHFVNGGTLFGYGDAMYITGNTYYNNNWKAIATGGGANAVIDSLGFKVYNNASASANATISPLLHLTVGPSEMVINDDSYDYDFRVESDSNTNMLYVDGSSSGAVHIGTNINVFGAADAYGMNLFDGGIANFSSNDASIHYWNIENLSTTRAVVTFYATRSSVGNISISTSGTTYNTTSDRRLKDNIEPIADGTEKLMEMNPVTHTWKADPNTGETVHGFIAQEMMNVVPEAVSGDPNGEEMMSMDYGRITPVLVAALQDAVKEITALKERVAELEAK